MIKRWNREQRVPSSEERKSVGYTYPEPAGQEIPSDREYVLFPQADTDFDPPLFFPTEIWKGGSQSGYRNLKNAFQVLYSTLRDLGYPVNFSAPRFPPVIFDWSGKHHDSNEHTDVIFMEHGWLPRTTYQLSVLGTNSRSHIARNYSHKELESSDIELVLEYLARMRLLFAKSVSATDRERSAGLTQGYPFVLVPFQLATDFNLKYSNSRFSEFYSSDASANIRFAQAIIDYVESYDLGMTVYFKQHPVDDSNLEDLKFKRSSSRLLTNASKLSTAALLSSKECQLVVSVNSNTLHEALVWDVPAIAMGTLMWNEEKSNRPFPKELDSAHEQLGNKIDTDMSRLSYVNNLMENQWYLSDFNNPLIAEKIVSSRANINPLELRRKFSVEIITA